MGEETRKDRSKAQSHLLKVRTLFVDMEDVHVKEIQLQTSGVHCHFSLEASFVVFRLLSWIHTSAAYSATLAIIIGRWQRITAVHEAAIRRPLS